MGLLHLFELASWYLKQKEKNLELIYSGDSAGLLAVYHYSYPNILLPVIQTSRFRKYTAQDPFIIEPHLRSGQQKGHCLLSNAGHRRLASANQGFFLTSNLQGTARRVGHRFLQPLCCLGSQKLKSKTGELVKELLIFLPLAFPMTLKSLISLLS